MRISDWSSDVCSSDLRLQASFGGTDLALWALVLTAIIGAGAYLVLTARGVLGPRAPKRERNAPREAAIVGLAVLATVGLVANDSSVAVPATMLIVVVPVLVLRQRRRAPGELA